MDGKSVSRQGMGMTRVGMYCTDCRVPCELWLLPWSLLGASISSPGFRVHARMVVWGMLNCTSGCLVHCWLVSMGPQAGRTSSSFVRLHVLQDLGGGKTPGKGGLAPESAIITRDAP